MKLDISEPTVKNKIKLQWHCITHRHQYENHYFDMSAALGKQKNKTPYVDCIRCYDCSIKIEKCLQKMEGRTYARYGRWDSTYE